MNTIDIYELRNLFTDDSQLCRIYDLTENAECIFEGEMKDIPEYMESCEVMSIDTFYINAGFDGYLGINVETE